ncbi:sigma-70 family RNA polymerase sigma factor [Tenacibaculum sp.]|uniref:sigma-70 family RNA polymerase sigma factor n=1 Tax=Tenacibaculum sp. TaxID=1906242 RepID=UPI003D14A3FB
MTRQKNSVSSWEDCYKQQRNFLVSYAFRMTGSLVDAEDIVQDTVFECLKHDFNTVSNHKAWMTRICSNKALDLLKSAHSKRNNYIGSWLPDMIPDAVNHKTSLLWEDASLELAESLTISFLVLLQNLRPVERAVFLLKDIFGYSFKEVSQLLEKNEANCRKIAERARNSINKQKKQNFSKPSPDAEKLIHQFFEAAKHGNQTKLEALLSDNSEFLSDGGGKVPAAPIILTKQKIADFFMALQKSPIFSSKDYRLNVAWVNFRPGMIISKRVENLWQPETVMSFEIENKCITRIFAQRNPEKLNILNKIT